jgi:N-formylglutamate deformylase
MTPFRLHHPSGGHVPIVVSVPHCGTLFPHDLKAQFKADLIETPDDTDWFVDRLYDFAPAMGMTLLTATYSRWVIDLNRDPQSKPLYTDGRIITGLCPVTNFLGEPLYADHRKAVSPDDIQSRLTLYYKPYHRQLQEELSRLKKAFGTVLLWDCHSIRQYVPTIHAEKFPDLILGDADQTSAGRPLIDAALKSLSASSYTLSHNYPFKGGYITRYFGRPEENQHALQLEMSKLNYMNDSEEQYDSSRAGKVRELLQRTFEQLILLLTQ